MAEYGVTEFADIIDAIDSGKFVLCRNNDSLQPMIYVDDVQVDFSVYDYGTGKFSTVYSDNS